MATETELEPAIRVNNTVEIIHVITVGIKDHWILTNVDIEILVDIFSIR